MPFTRSSVSVNTEWSRTVSVVLDLWITASRFAFVATLTGLPPLKNVVTVTSSETRSSWSEKLPQSTSGSRKIPSSTKCSLTGDWARADAWVIGRAMNKAIPRGSSVRSLMRTGFLPTDFHEISVKRCSPAHRSVGGS